MSSELHKDLLRLREEVSAAMQEVTPSRDVGDALVLGTAWLGVIEMRIRNTHNLEERRSLNNDFSRRRSAIEGAVRALKREGLRRRGFDTKPKHRSALP